MSTEKHLRSRQTGTALAGLALAGAGWMLTSQFDDTDQSAGVPALFEQVAGPLIWLGVAVLAAAIIWAVWSSLPSVRVRRMLGHDGWAGWRDLRAGLSADGLRRTYGREVRPDLAGKRREPATEYGLPVGRLVTGSLGVRGQRVYFPHSYGVLIAGPPGAAKSSQLANFVLTAPGGVYVSTTKTEFVKHTAAVREQKGRTWVFNPGGIGGVPSTFGWNPVEGCHDQRIAKARAAAMVRGGSAATENADFWAGKAEEIIRCYLMAAALEGLGMAAVHEWATHPDDPMPIEIMRRHPDYAPGSWVSTLESYLDGDPRTRANMFATVTPCVAFLDSPTVIMACNPSPDQRFDLEEFLANGTLYVVNGEDRALAPLMTALTEHIQAGAREVAARTRNERLTPGLIMVLDEVAQTTPVPLDKWASESRGHGISIIAGIQGRAQLETRYGREAARTISNSLTMKIVLSGGMMSDQEDLHYFSGLAGPRWVVKVSTGQSSSSGGSSTSTHHQRVQEPVLTPDRLKRLPRGFALIDGPGEHTAVVRFRNGFKRAAAAARRLEQGGPHAAAAQARTAPRADVAAPAPVPAEQEV